VTKFCVTKLCVAKWCVTKLCVCVRKMVCVCVKDGYTGVCDKVMCDKGGDKDGVPESCV